MIATVILAAGAGRRLGGVAKALVALPDGETFLSAVVRAAQAGGAKRHLVVVGEPHRLAVEALARELALEVAVNPDPARGMASSIEVGFGRAFELFADCAAALLWPVDHPRVRAETVRALAARIHPERVVVPIYGGRGGHPALVGRAIWPELSRAGQMPEGARTVLRSRPERVSRALVKDPGVIADVDYPADLP